MKIILTAIDSALADAWDSNCGDLDCVSLHRGSILDIDCSAVVSPANSFGFMDGGIDAIYCQHFGWQVQDQLQQLIRKNHHGELLVGTAEIVATGDRRIPFIIAAPTMRVPMILQSSVNPYLAARAALLLAQRGKFGAGPLRGKKIGSLVESIAFPGLGTGVGRVPPSVCAQQVRSAIENVIYDRRDYPQSWAEAQIRHQEMFTDDVRDLQYRD